MRLFRFGAPGAERPGLLLDNGTHADASAFGEDWNETFFASNGLARLADWLQTNPELPAVDTAQQGFRFGPCVARPSKIVCVGLNFSDHAAESNMQPPAEPVLFFKSTTALVGPNDPVVKPKGSTKLDWEVELAVVIGKTASYVGVEEAIDYVAGFALHNDYSERAFQLERAGQWVKGKSCDTFAPLGPYLVTADAVDFRNLGMRLSVNGVKKQNGTTANMIFDVPTLVSYISQFMTLLPGDVISTGTPAGVGLGQKPEPQYLNVGDVVELSIDGLGNSAQTVVAYSGQ